MILIRICTFVSILASIGAVVAWLVLGIQTNRIRGEINQIESEQKQLTQKSRKVNQYESNLSSMVGLDLDPGENITAESIQQLRDNAVDEQEGLKNPEGSIQDLVRVMELQIRRLASEHRKVRLRKSNVEQHLAYQESRLQRYEDTYSNKQSLLTEHQQELATKRERLDQQIQDVREQANQAINSVDNEIAQAQDTHNERISKLDNKISQVRSSINQLKQQQEAQFVEISEVDGKIVRTDPEAQWVYINLGKGDRLKPGIRFGVYSTSGENGRNRIGMVKVKQVFSSYARCRIISEANVNRPILEGDRIDNPFFSTEGPKRIALVGNFQNENRIQNVITSSGSRFEEDLSPELDFAITGQNYEGSSRFRTARDLGILLVKFENVSGFIEE